MTVMSMGTLPLVESKPMFNRNGRHYPPQLLDDYVKFRDLKYDLKDICLEVTDEGVSAYIKSGYFDSFLSGSIEFQYKSNMSVQRVLDNDYKFMEDGFLNEVIERITLFMDGNDFTTKVINTYDKCSSHHKDMRNGSLGNFNPRGWFSSLKRIINKRKGRIYITRLEFFNRNYKPTELVCWDLVTNEGFGNITHPKILN